jgi:hypothetical protein
MKRNSEKFLEHDPEGFEKYLLAVEQGKQKISGATLLPHELIAEAGHYGTILQNQATSKFALLWEYRMRIAETQLRVIEAQWRTLISELKKHGKMESSLAICDVSGSMGYIGRKLDKHKVDPIFPSLALSLVLANLAPPPFNSGFISFSGTPEFIKLDLTQPLHEIIEKTVSSEWGMNTDLYKVFVDLLLPLAIKNKVKKEDMIKRLFIFSDMQFDNCAYTDDEEYVKVDAANWTTNYDAIDKAYNEAGYDVPQIVFWDLSRQGVGKTFEVESDRKGVAMMSGFSSSMLNVFMGEVDVEEEEWEDVVKRDFNPMNMMKKALGNRSYDELVVLD